MEMGRERERMEIEGWRWGEREDGDRGMEMGRERERGWR